MVVRDIKTRQIEENVNDELNAIEEYEKVKKMDEFLQSRNENYTEKS